MSGTKGMIHYRAETKQEAVRLVVEEHQAYAEVATKLAIRKADRIKAWVRNRIAGSAVRSSQYRAIHHLKEEFAVKAMCEFFAVSRAAYYEWVKTLEEPDPNQMRWNRCKLLMKLHTAPMGIVGLPWTFSKNRVYTSITRQF